MTCEHEFVVQDRDENNDRIRTTEACKWCNRMRYGCFAHRLDDEGREAWGRPGIWLNRWAE